MTQAVQMETELNEDPKMTSAVGDFMLVKIFGVKAYKIFHDKNN